MKYKIEEYQDGKSMLHLDSGRFIIDNEVADFIKKAKPVMTKEEVEQAILEWDCLRKSWKTVKRCEIKELAETLTIAKQNTMSHNEIKEILRNYFFENGMKEIDLKDLASKLIGRG